MNEFETVLHIMMMNHVSYDDLSKRLGQTNGGNIYNTLNKNKNIYVSSLKKILDELGYEIVVRKKGKTDGGYVINDDNTPSPLRFHDMSLNLGAILGDTQKIVPNVKPYLTVGERNQKTEALKKRINELTFFECDNELREIWGMKDPTPEGKQPYNEYEQEYEKYKKEFYNLYNQPPIVEVPVKPVEKHKNYSPRKKKEPIPTPPVIVSTGAKGKIITEDNFVEKDMSHEAMRKRGESKQHEQRDLLLSLTAGFDFDD